MFIKLKNEPNSNVGLKVTIDGIDHWNYRYTCDNPITNSEKLEKSMNHDLGIVANLKGDVNSWIIELWNVTDEEKEVTVKLEWVGAVQGQPTWPVSTTKIKVTENGYKLLSGSCKFL